MKDSKKLGKDGSIVAMEQGEEKKASEVAAKTQETFSNELLNSRKKLRRSASNKEQDP